MSIRCGVVVLVSLSVVVSCAPDPKVVEARAKLDLATQKSDLDEMFLAIRTLDAHGAADSTQKQELEKLQQAIGHRENMRRHRSNHDHEQVVNEADALLDLYPNNDEGRRAFKESGLIFGFLEDAVNSMEQCVRRDEEGGSLLVVTQAEDGTSETDFGGIVHHLSEAQRAVDSALSLDPLFDKALALRATLSGVRETLGYMIGIQLVSLSATVGDGYTEVFTSIYSSMQDSLGSLSPSEVWELYEPLITELESATESATQMMDEYSSFLSKCEVDGSEEFVSTARATAALALSLKNAVANPTGSMIDYRNSVMGYHGRLGETVRGLRPAMPTDGAITDAIERFATFLSGWSPFDSPDTTKPILEDRKELVAA